MKRYNNLFEKIATMDNLILAEKKARNGKQNTYGVKQFDKHRELYLQQLLESLKSGTYRTSQYSTFTIFEPKERLIFRLPYYPDRIVHHAIMNIMEPIWNKLFISNTFACIKGRGIHKCFYKLKEDLYNNQEDTKYCLKLDIRKFYPSINHEILKSIIRKKIKDEKLLILLDEIIDSAVGVPIGNYLSQYFANLYLTYFDHYMKEVVKCRFYYRYADDIVILGKTKEWLHGAMKIIEKYLSEKLDLKIKGNWQVFPVEIRGIDFLGYIFRHKYIKMRQRTKRKIIHVCIVDSRIERDIRTTLMKMSSYSGWIMHCDSYILKAKLNKLYNGKKIFV